MTYQTTITSKGQVTVPVKIRQAMKLSKNTKLTWGFDSKLKQATLKPAPDILEVVKKFKRKKIDPVKAREYMEKNYERA